SQINALRFAGAAERYNASGGTVDIHMPGFYFYVDFPALVYPDSERVGLHLMSLRLHDRPFLNGETLDVGCIYADKGVCPFQRVAAGHLDTQLVGFLNYFYFVRQLPLDSNIIILARYKGYIQLVCNIKFGKRANLYGGLCPKVDGHQDEQEKDTRYCIHTFMITYKDIYRLYLPSEKCQFLLGILICALQIRIQKIFCVLTV